MADPVNGPAQGKVNAFGGLWRRQIMTYPDTGTRATYLAILIIGTIVLYYQLYIAGAVAPKILSGDGLSFPFYLYIMVVSNALGAFGSLAAGLADRWGRANLVAYGLLATGSLAAFAIPNVSGKWGFAVVLAIIGYIGGIILVATPALVRDYTQQLGRSTAMGIWALGPVIGSLAVAVVSSSTLPHLHPWQDQYVISGLVALGIGLIAVIGLRELSPHIRDEFTEALRTRAVAEARSRGTDLEEIISRPWRRVLRLDVVGPAFGISVFQLVYSTAIPCLTLYLTVLHGLSLPSANSLGDWLWAFAAGAAIVTGIVSDLVRVRKPFMIAGAVGAIVMMIVFSRLGPGTSYGTFAVVLSALGVFVAIAYAPWLASFTETLDRLSPALAAAGLAVWGWITRAVIAVALLVLPLVVGSMTAAAAGQWRNWWWVCVAGQVVFLPTIFLMPGRWSPRKARQEAEEHERVIQRELKELRAEP